MTDGLFYLDNEDLVAMRVTQYDAEDVLQELIEKHPDLLAGGQMSPGDPRRWLLIKREQPLPDSDLSRGRFSVDHLFVDQDAVPTLVEVKRSTDTRIRREVVGQMLDYAANGVRYWPATSLQSAFTATQEATGADPATSIAGLRDDPACTVDAFFADVETNLRAGRLRLVFVADVVPDELRRIVEFLNEQMSQAEVFAVEVKQYRADGRDDRVLVPTLIGRNAASSAKHDRTTQRRAREETLAASTTDTLRLLELIGELAHEQGLTTHETPVGLVLETPAREWLATVYLDPYNMLEVYIRELRDRGWDAQADSMFAALQKTTPKRLAAKHTNVSTTDIVTHWPEVKSALVAVAGLYRSASSIDDPTDPKSLQA
ncbi:MAG: hypothetical protein EOL91_02575 [Actinobacteria bacterium]|nr:hypothetical protein [Actinomycetota bacterium]